MFAPGATPTCRPSRDAPASDVRDEGPVTDGVVEALTAGWPDQPDLRRPGCRGRWRRHDTAVDDGDADAPAGQALRPRGRRAAHLRVEGRERAGRGRGARVGRRTGESTFDERNARRETERAELRRLDHAADGVDQGEPRDLVRVDRRERGACVRPVDDDVERGVRGSVPFQARLGELRARGLTLGTAAGETEG